MNVQINSQTQSDTLYLNAVKRFVRASLFKLTEIKWSQVKIDCTKIYNGGWN